MVQLRETRFMSINANSLCYSLLLIWTSSPLIAPVKVLWNGILFWTFSLYNKAALLRNWFFTFELLTLWHIGAILWAACRENGGMFGFDNRASKGEKGLLESITLWKVSWLKTSPSPVESTKLVPYYKLLTRFLNSLSYLIRFLFIKLVPKASSCHFFQLETFH